MYNFILDYKTILTVDILLIIFFMIWNALVVSSKRALDYVDRNSIKEKLENEPNSSKFKNISMFLSEPSKYHYADHIAAVCNLIICTFLFLYVFICYFNSYINPFVSQNSFTLIILFIVFVYILFIVLYTALCDVLPKKIAAQTSEKTAIRLIGFQKFIYIVTFPIAWLCKKIANLILLIIGKERDVDDKYFTENRVMSMLDMGQEQGEIKEEGRKMIDSIFEFDDLLAHEIMTPRTDILFIDITDDREDYFDELMELTYSRIPVCDGDPDKIIGILHIKDYLYTAAHKGFDKVDIKKLLRPAYFVPETKNIDSLFLEMQKEKQHIAILIDEFGGVSGLVSIEDIIEQIVGDIDDEFDEEDKIIKEINENTFIVDGNVDLDDLNEETGIKLESDSSETIGGFIIDLTGEIPKIKKKYKIINYQNYTFEILKVEDQRIIKVKISISNKKD